MSGKHAKVTMTEGPLLPIIIRVALPITFANLFQAGYDIVNSFWLGRLGQEAIGAVTAIGPLFYVLSSLGSGLSTAGAVLVAQNAGAKRLEVLDHVAAQTLLMVAAMALAFAVGGAATTAPALWLIGVEPSIAALASEYLLI